MRPNSNFPLKRLEIIKVALDLFLVKGYEQTKISHILKTANLSKGGMYHYFESKEAILDGVIEYALSEELTDFDKKLHSADTVFDKLELYLDNSPLDYSDYLKKFTQFKGHSNSIVSYRIKDISASFGIPYLQTVIESGIDEKIFKTDYPEELAFVLYQAGEKLVTTVANLNQSGNLDANKEKRRKILAFNQLLTCTLQIEENYSQKLYQQLTRILMPEDIQGGQL
ncbi:TetR/AcrR family transcriptional regulator [uncultured Vagococcus sp.]|uniref:TetR/AcrR family transcriptional regulator n=1 Tax=uncultured Vagococcus sp. TaxID=189676 RepID=UPI0028D43661|nr:TetR/AcrR family transcriptional regulator [uncultured Vagococcus sp.]